MENKEMQKIDQRLVGVIDDVEDIKKNIQQMETERVQKTSEILNIEQQISELKVNVEEAMKRNIAKKDE